MIHTSKKALTELLSTMVMTIIIGGICAYLINMPITTYAFMIFTALIFCCGASCITFGTLYAITRRSKSIMILTVFGIILCAATIYLWRTTFAVM